MLLLTASNVKADMHDVENIYPSIYFEADNLLYEDDGKNIKAIGNAKLFYKSYIVEASEITYFQDIDQVIANGNVTMSDKGKVKIIAEKITLSDELKNGFLEGANMILADGSKIRADKANINLTKSSTFTGASYTFCEKCIEDDECPYTWEFQSDEVIHDELNKKIIFKNVKFNVLDKTLLSLPKFSYPDFTVKRQSGFLMPSYSYSNFYGHAIKTPYIYILDNSSDLTVSPFITTKQGPLFDFEYRKKTENGGDIYFNPNFIYQADPSSVAPGNEKLRASIKTHGVMPINSNFEWGWDATFASDETYMRKYSLDGRTKYNSNIYIEGLKGQNYLNIAAINYKNLLNETETAQATLLPRIDHQYNFNLPNLKNLSFENNIVNVQRTSGDEQIRLTSEIKWDERYISDNGIIIEPIVSLRADHFRTYDESENEYTNFSRVTPNLSTSISWPFFENTSLGKQIFEPKLAFGYVGNEKTFTDLQNEDAQTFNFNSLNLYEMDRSLGFDRIDGGSKLSLGVNYSLQDSIGGLFNASVGQSYHINGLNSLDSDQWSGTDNYHSDIVGSISYNLNDAIMLDYKTRYDNSSSDNAINEFNLEMHDLNNYSFGVNYTDIKAEANWLNSGLNANDYVALSELSGFLEFGLTHDWSIISSGTFNLESDSFVNNQIGLRYDDECLAFDISYRENLFSDRDIEKDRSILLNFELKTAAEDLKN
tara:strand:- start:790 stop:2922 length:2133 start_codon:yes stop_codon:yes gene_type:complete